MNNPLTNQKIKRFLDKINKSELDLCAGYDRGSRQIAFLEANNIKKCNRAITIVDCTPSDVRNRCFIGFPEDLTKDEFYALNYMCPRGYSLTMPEDRTFCMEMKKVVDSGSAL